jgi:hypothetical protein
MGGRPSKPQGIEYGLSPVQKENHLLDARTQNHRLASFGTAAPSLSGVRKVQTGLQQNHQKQKSSIPVLLGSATSTGYKDMGRMEDEIK